MPLDLAESPVRVGAPYRAGDSLEIEHGGDWAEVQVLSVDYDDAARFGCHWRMLVGKPGLFGPLHVIHVDDDGRNYTITRRCRPSERIEA